MSRKMSMLMHELRSINNKRIVEYSVLQEDNEIYPQAIKTLMNRFGEIVTENDLLEKLKIGSIDLDFARDLISQYEGTPDEGFARFIVQVPPEDYAFTENMMYAATIRSIENEQRIARDIVLGKEEFIPLPGYESKAERIKGFVEYYKQIGISEDYPIESKRNDAQSEFADQVFRTKTRPTFKEKLALEYGARYLSTLNDSEFFDLVIKAGLINDEKKASLTRKYNEIDLKEEAKPHKQTNKIRKEQEATIRGMQDVMKEFEDTGHDEI